MKLEGSCCCGAVKFTVDAYAPAPYMRCYCSICRKSDRILDMLGLAGADDRRRHGSLLRDPGERHLRARHAALGGDLGDALDDRAVGLRRGIVELAGEDVGLVT